MVWIRKELLKGSDARRCRPPSGPRQEAASADRSHHGRVIKDELWEAAKEEEMKIPWKEANEGLPVSEEQYQERFWRRRLDGIGLDTATKEFLAIEFKRT